MPRPTRKSTDLNAEAYRAALLGDPCPPDYNPFVYFDLQYAPSGYKCDHTEAMRELWLAERTALMREWTRRRKRGQPPGALFDKPTRRTKA